VHDALHDLCGHLVHFAVDINDSGCNRRVLTLRLEQCSSPCILSSCFIDALRGLFAAMHSSHHHHHHHHHHLHHHLYHHSQGTVTSTIFSWPADMSAPAAVCALSFAHDTIRLHGVRIASHHRKHFAGCVPTSRHSEAILTESRCWVSRAAGLRLWVQPLPNVELLVSIVFATSWFAIAFAFAFACVFAFALDSAFTFAF
jgi:hypothetical protein